MVKRYASADEELEALRKEAKTRYYIVFVLTGILFVFYMFLVICAQVQDRSASIWESVALAVFVPVFLSIPTFFGLFYVIAKSVYNRFSDTFKDRYVVSVLGESGLFDELGYNRKEGFTFRDIRNAGVVDCGMERYFLSEDMVTGRYRDIRFAMSDVNTRRLVKSGKTSRVESIFNGQVFRFSVFDDAKVSRGYLQIFQKEFLSDIKGWTAEHKIETESAAFNKKFDVYATDEHNAYYILTPQLMEKIEEFSQQVGCQVALSFHGQVMFVALNRSVSMFDPSVDKPVPEQKRDILKDAKLLQAAGDILLCQCSGVNTYYG